MICAAVAISLHTDAADETLFEVADVETEPRVASDEPAGTDEPVAVDEPADDGSVGVVAGAVEEPGAGDPGGSETVADDDTVKDAGKDSGDSAEAAVVEESTSGGTRNMLLTVGIGLGIAVVVLLLATVLLGRGK